LSRASCERPTLATLSSIGATIRLPASAPLQPLVLFALSIALWAFAKSWDYSKR